MPAEIIHCRIPATCAGMRLDQVLAGLLPAYSRSRLQQWIKAGQVEVDGKAVRPRLSVLGGEQVRVILPQEPETVDQAQAIPLDIRYADADLLVINKPAGLVVHPAAGNPDGTLVNALLHHVPELAALPRAGLVHRLDKDTSGLLVVARCLRAHTALVEQLQARTLEREYQAVVNGVMTAGGRIEAPIGRHPMDRQRMAVTTAGKPAITHYRVIRRFRAHTQLRIQLETGRTHQIRVHLAHIRYPLVGDPVYGGRRHLPPGLTDRCLAVLQGFKRQALHASRLGLIHPGSGARLVWQAELPADMVELLTALAEDCPT
jgi:23S rRNA pseudouridine1911/1915/1917 synthase